jgi:hypothetical protein
MVIRSDGVDYTIGLFQDSVVEVAYDLEKQRKSIGALSEYIPHALELCPFANPVLLPSYLVTQLYCILFQHCTLIHCTLHAVS